MYAETLHAHIRRRRKGTKVPIDCVIGRMAVVHVAHSADSFRGPGLHHAYHRVQPIARRLTVEVRDRKTGPYGLRLFSIRSHPLAIT
jgi:hypothetical protein